MHEQSSPADFIQGTLTRARALASQRAREREGCHWIEGIRPFVQAFDAGIQFDTIVYSRILNRSDLAEMLVRRLVARGVPRVRVSPEDFRSVSSCPRASGIGAILRQHWTKLEHALPTQGLCWLVLEYIRSPGNLGTILRTAEACGAAGIILLGPRCDPFDRAAVRASMGGLFHLRLVRATHEQLQGWARTHGVRLVGLSPNADRLWTELPQSLPIALVLGEERRGLSDPVRALCQHEVRLPMSGRADSLNVGVAAGVVMYELVRRAHRPVRAAGRTFAPP